MRPSAQRYSIATVAPLDPTEFAQAFHKCGDPLIRQAEAEAGPKNPMVRSFDGCCARAASGSRAAQCEYEFPPSDVDCHAIAPAGGRVHAIEGTISRFSEGTNNAFALRKS